MLCVIEEIVVKVYKNVDKILIFAAEIQLLVVRKIENFNCFLNYK